MFYAKSDSTKFEILRVKHKSGIHNSGSFLGKESFKEGLKEELESLGKRIEDWWSDIFCSSSLRGWDKHHPP